MKRREFIGSVTAGVIAAGAGIRASAQASNGPNPKIMLFGFTVISRGGSGIVAHMPKVGSHETFAAGPSKVISLLGSRMSQKPVPGLNSGIGVGHDDLKGSDISLLCLTDPAVAVGKNGDPAQMSNLDAFVPKLPVLAGLMQGGSHAFGAYPPGSITIALNGGTLRMPGKKSNNPGVQDVPWQFQFNGKDIDKPYHLTDILVFDSTAAHIEVVIGKNTVTLGPGQQLWFINVPTVKDTTDKNAMVIEHAHEWFSLLTPAVAGKIEAVAKKPVSWPAGSWLFKHPCAPQTPAPPMAGPPGASTPQPVKPAFFPPDTDPCFIVME
jgi:hypothetical protein